MSAERAFGPREASGPSRLPDRTLRSLGGHYHDVRRALEAAGWFYQIGTDAFVPLCGVAPAETSDDGKLQAGVDAACGEQGQTAPAASRPFPQVPRLYDITTDEYRPVTQAELDRLVLVEQGFGRFCIAVDEARDRLRATVISAHGGAKRV